MVCSDLQYNTTFSLKCFVKLFIVTITHKLRPKTGKKISRDSYNAIS